MLIAVFKDQYSYYTVILPTKFLKISWFGFLAGVATIRDFHGWIMKNIVLLCLSNDYSCIFHVYLVLVMLYLLQGGESFFRSALASMEAVYLSRNPTAKAVLELVQSARNDQICYDHIAFRTFGVYFVFTVSVLLVLTFIAYHYMAVFCIDVEKVVL